MRPVKEPLLDGRQGQGVRSLVQHRHGRGRANGASPFLRGHGHGGQGCNRLVLEHLFGRQPNALLAGPTDDLQVQDGISPQIEEVVMNADALLL